MLHETGVPYCEFALAIIYLYSLPKLTDTRSRRTSFRPPGGRLDSHTLFYVGHPYFQRARSIGRLLALHDPLVSEGEQHTVTVPKLSMVAVFEGDYVRPLSVCERLGGGRS